MPSSRVIPVGGDKSAKKMIETRPKMVDNLTCDYAEAKWHDGNPIRDERVLTSTVSELMNKFIWLRICGDKRVYFAIETLNRLSRPVDFCRNSAE